MQKRHHLGVFLALVASASTWFYVERILKPQQIEDAAAHGRPRGNLSDLYPRWLGARELLLHHRNPYADDITREIQQGYYGRLLDPSRPDDPKDQQGFAYPVYVVFLLAPTVGLPFDEVRAGFRWFLIVVAAASVLLWLWLLRWRPPCAELCVFVVLILGWLPMVQGIKLQQLSLLVAGLLAGCSACLAGEWLFLSGVVLAVATIKPQLTWPLVAWLLMWACAELRTRWKFLAGFGSMMLLLLAGAEWIVPGWLGMFIAAIGRYHQYTQNQSVLVWMFGSIVGRILELSSVVLCAVCVWHLRREPANSARFGPATALVLALTVVVVPMFAPYNQVLLAPAILALVRRATSKEPLLPSIRLASAIGGLMVIWPWIATVGLTCAAFWMTPAIRQKVWPMPFYSNFMVPIFVFGLAVLHVWTTGANGLRDSAAAE